MKVLILLFILPFIISYKFPCIPGENKYGQWCFNGRYMSTRQTLCINIKPSHENLDTIIKCKVNCCENILEFNENIKCDWKCQGYLKLKCYSNKRIGISVTVN